MRILHTEASPGWGGQELRTLKEAIGMRKRGHELFFAVQKGAGLVPALKQEGFEFVELSFSRRSFFKTFLKLLAMIRKVDIVNTHSSKDAWLAGLAARFLGKKLIRTRHLSTAIRKGMNSYLLYNALADFVVTTCQRVVDPILEQAKLDIKRCLSVPTGVNTDEMIAAQEEQKALREQFQISEQDFVIGCVCVMRSWKGLQDLLKAVKLLEGIPSLKCLIVGSGVSEEHFHQLAKDLSIQDKVVFTGQIDPPYAAMKLMDVFCLLSTANEGVSQASLQAAYLQRPLITTDIGGLDEVCLHGSTGFVVPTFSADAVAARVYELYQNPSLRESFGKKAKELVLEKFTMRHTLDQMEKIYQKIS